MAGAPGDSLGLVEDSDSTKVAKETTEGEN